MILWDLKMQKPLYTVEDKQTKGLSKAVLCQKKGDQCISGDFEKNSITLWNL